MTVLTLDGLHETKIVNLVGTRDTVKKIEFAHDFPAANIDEAYLTVRDQDDTVVLTLTKELNSGQWTLTTDYEGEIELDDDDTAGLDADYSYKYGVQLVGVDGGNQAPQVGTLRLIDQIVYDDATAGYETWQTRSQRDVIQNSLLATAVASTLSADAAASATTITLLDASMFSAGDLFTIFDATNDESHDIASIATNTITLDTGGDGGTLANAFDEHSVVIKDF